MCTRPLERTRGSSGTHARKLQKMSLKRSHGMVLSQR